MAWVRDGDTPDKIPVSFVVTKADHPELAEWLWSLPFRKQSAVIRNILSEASKMVKAEDEVVRPPGKGESAQRTTERGSSNHQPVKPAPVGSSGTPQGGHGMTAATAAILRRQQEEF